MFKTSRGYFQNFEKIIFMSAKKRPAGRSHISLRFFRANAREVVKKKNSKYEFGHETY